MERSLGGDVVNGMEGFEAGQGIVRDAAKSRRVCQHSHWVDGVADDGGFRARVLAAQLVRRSGDPALRNRSESADSIFTGEHDATLERRAQPVQLTVAP
jgi:hypothetical protein